MRPKRRRFQNIANILVDSSATRFKLKDKVTLYKIAQKWAEIVGQSVAEHAMPASFRKGLLVIHVDHPTWINELIYIKNKFLEKLSLKLEDYYIKDIRFQIGEVQNYIRMEDSDNFETKPLTDNELEFIEDTLLPIKDDSVKDAARKAMMKKFQRC